MTDLHFERLDATDGGQQPPLLMLHGLLGSSTNWRSIAKRLVGGRAVITLDARNHGKSGHRPTMSYAEMADDVEQLIGELGIDEADVLGHSMGGKTAMRCALRKPVWLRKLVVVDIAPVPHSCNFTLLINALRSLPVTTSETRQELDHMLAERIPELALRAFLLQNLERQSRGFRWRINLDAIAEQMDELLGFDVGAQDQFEGPTLFVLGSDSEYVSNEHIPSIEQLFPAARINSIASASHWLHAQQPQRFVEVVDQFLLR